LADLSLAEIATLAGVPKAPSARNPITNPDGARVRRNYVLKRMRDLQHISEDDYLTAKNATVTAIQQITPVEIEANYVAEMARSYMIQNYGKNAYTKGTVSTLRSTATIKRQPIEHYAVA